MKKLILSFLAFGIISSGISQAVSDRTTVPIAVNLNQVLRLNVFNGGNLEFTFNTIAQYKAGINSGAVAAAAALGAVGAQGFYQTQFTVAASSDWELHMGAEDATLIGTDAGGTMTLDNIGYSITADGIHKFTAGGAATDVVKTSVGNQGVDIVPLTQFPGAAALIEKETVGAGVGALSNAGDVADNAFTIYWRVGTTEGTMNAVALIEQNLAPDRYITNVLFDLQIEQ
tara:strand:+ start:841 stop:1527 length:687 start_codon:yes stop_codon:yes gene_type:complete